MWVARSMFAALWPTCSMSIPSSTTKSPSTRAATPGTSGAFRGCFSPRKFSMTRVESLTATFMGKCAATAFIFASKPFVTPSRRFFVWLSQVWSSAWARFRLAGIESVRVTWPPEVATRSASWGNPREAVPRGPLTDSVGPWRVTLTPAGSGTSTWSRSASSVDIGEKLPSDLELAGLGVAHDALVRRQDENAEVLGRQEAGLVPFDGATSHGDAGLDDAAGVDPAREGHFVLAALPGRHEGEVLDVLVLAEDPED